MSESRWQFWIDVGGTFTDCVAVSPQGDVRRRKVLSSAVVKGRVESGSNAAVVLIGDRSGECDDFWAGYRFRLLDVAGRALAEATVRGSRGSLAGELRLGEALSSLPLAGQAYELVSPEEAPVLAIRLFLGLKLDEPIPPCTVRLGTTRGTNALLTRRGARTALITTRGFGDVLKIGYQERPRLFDLVIRKPTPLYDVAAEIEERIAADGRVLEKLNEEQVRTALRGVQQQGVESLAVCLMNAYANPAHELVVERIASELGFEEISVSHRVSPLMKMVPRGDTTVVDAYLNPVLRKYLARLRSSLPGSDVRLMTSAGGLLSPEAFTGKDSILSGPAGGVVGFARAAQAAGYDRAIGFDMGGTSTDVSRFDGRFEQEFETQKAGVRIVTPMMAIETVAAGGGSVCWFDGVKLVVGPQSAGADPGPACYGRGGPLTVTDCNLKLGRLLPEFFPLPLDERAVEQRLAEIADAVEQATGQRPESQEVAEGFLRIANTNMAAAIRSISIAKGYDPRQYVLVPFGAAGPQHACAVASELGIIEVLIPHDAGVLSAVGIGQADVVRHRMAGVYQRLDGLEADALQQLFAELADQAGKEVISEEVPPAQIEIRRSLDLRYEGVDAALAIAEPEDGNFAREFAAEHHRRFGYVQENRPLEVVAARVEAIGKTGLALHVAQPAEAQVVTAEQVRHAIFDGQSQPTAFFRRSDLRPGALIQGPAIVAEELTTVIVFPGWTAELAETHWLLRYTGSQARAEPAAATAADNADPILLEVFNNHFTAIAAQMGITLRSTASSVNVKERLDFSCAIFTANGDLVVNAPHIPVHLGAMSETVKRIIADNPDMRPGDVFVTNDPYRGGSHLPDVTVVTPIYVGGMESADYLGATRPIFFTASRAHHAEIGGITPGSMPPFSRNLAEEGVLIRNFKLVDAGRSRLEKLRQLLSSGPYPSRAVNDNLADIAAQMAANRQGAHDLERLIAQHSLPVVVAYTQHIQAAAEQKMRQALRRLEPGRREFVDHLDDGTPIRVAIDIREDEATIDFTGTGGVLASNLNANRAIVTAAVLYCLRLLIGEEIPLNQGVLAPVALVLPECLLNPPEHADPRQCPAIVGGNVETSQRVVDVLLGAFRLAAASQGTMNNLLFGNERFGYYETICGGSGATATADGADAVHTHMTNTRLTDPEVLERRFPVLLREFGIRENSAGNGQFRGGNGVRRTLEFLQPLKLSLLTQRRGPYAPYGLEGGRPGALGRNTLVRNGGVPETLPAQVHVDVGPGDRLTIETPGGGGWGLSRVPPQKGAADPLAP